MKRRRYELVSREEQSHRQKKKENPSSLWKHTLRNPTSVRQSPRPQAVAAHLVPVVVEARRCELLPELVHHVLVLLLYRRLERGRVHKLPPQRPSLGSHALHEHTDGHSGQGRERRQVAS
jgi:hypothetical protein